MPRQILPKTLSLKRSSSSSESRLVVVVVVVVAVQQNLAQHFSKLEDRAH